MWFYAARRILYAMPIAIGVTVICFCLVYLAPGDPIQMLLPPDASQQDVEYLKKLYGFDKPIPVQYFNWLGARRHRRSRRVAADQPAGARRGLPRALQHRCHLVRRGDAGLLARLRAGDDRGLLRGPSDRPHRHRHRGDRRQRAQLLARHRPGHRVRRRARLCCPPPAWAPRAPTTSAWRLGPGASTRSCRSSPCRWCRSASSRAPRARRWRRCWPRTSCRRCAPRA